METKGDEKGNCNGVMTLPKLTEASKKSFRTSDIRANI
jgi:hypothetical protein